MNVSNSIPWREAFPDIRDEEGPAVVLRPCAGGKG
jgi:hypothetical protein